jgi:predicted acyl esterase
LYLQNGGKLGFTKPQNENGVTSYVSDPNRPVPFSGKINDGFSAEYMVEDQRFAYQRPDVISFETDTLKDDLTMVGNILESEGFDYRNRCRLDSESYRRIS